MEAAAQQTLLKAGYDTEFHGQAKISSAEAGWLVATDFCRRGARRARKQLAQK